MKKLFLIIIAVTVWLIPLSAQAAELRASGNITIPSSEVINNDLYISGGTVVIDGRVNGDLLVSGGNVTVNGSVSDDVMATGGTLILNGSVDQSIRAAGGTLSLNGKIGQDLVVAGGTVDIGAGSTIGRDAIIASGNGRLSGRVGRGLRASAGDFIIDGQVGKNAFLDVTRLTLTDRAIIKGNLTYKSENKANIASDAKVGGKIIHKARPQARNTSGRIFSFIALYFAAFLFGVVLFLLFPKRTIQIADTVTSSPWVSLLLGLALLVLIPIVAAIIMIFLITIPLSLTAIALYALGIYLAKVFVGLALGRWASGYFKFQMHDILALLVGLLVIMLLGLIPFIGPVIRFLYILFGLGAAGYVLYRIIRERSEPSGA